MVPAALEAELELDAEGDEVSAGLTLIRITVFEALDGAEVKAELELELALEDGTRGLVGALRAPLAAADRCSSVVLLVESDPTRSVSLRLRLRLVFASLPLPLVESPPSDDDSDEALLADDDDDEVDSDAARRACAVDFLVFFCLAAVAAVVAGAAVAESEWHGSDDDDDDRHGDDGASTGWRTSRPPACGISLSPSLPLSISKPPFHRPMARPISLLRWYSL